MPNISRSKFALLAAAASFLIIGAIGDEREPDALTAPLHLEAYDQSTGRPLTARLRVVPVGLFERARHLLVPDGALDVALAAGRHRLVVSHGPEWSIAEQTVELRAGTPYALRVGLQRAVDGAAWTGCDLHVHTAHSPDGDLAVEERASSLAAEDIAFAVTTDHNHVTDPSAAFAAQGVASLAGAEVTSWQPEFGHFNAFPLRTAPAYKRTNSRDLLRALRADPATFVQINHPRLEHHIGYFELVGLDHDRPLPELGFDGLEVWNGYDLARPARRDVVFRDWLKLGARGIRLVATGGSDSHKLAEPLVGYPRTYVKVPRAEAHDTAKLLAALKAGRVVVSSGPLLDVTVEGKAPGDTVWLDDRAESVEVRITAHAPAWMALERLEIWLGPERVWSETIDRPSTATPRIERVVQLPLVEPAGLVVTVSGGRSMEALLGRSDVFPHAFSNPVWLVRAPSNVAQLSPPRGERVARD